MPPKFKFTIFEKHLYGLWIIAYPTYIHNLSVAHKQPTSVAHKQPTRKELHSPFLSQINIVLYKQWPTNSSVNHQRDYWNCFLMNQWQTNQFLYSSGSTELANYSSVYPLHLQDVRIDKRQLAQMMNLCRLPTDRRLGPRLALNLP